MGFRFRRSKGKKRTTVGIPGTGMSYTTTSNIGPGSSGYSPTGYGTTEQQPFMPKPKKPIHKRWWFWVIVAFLGLFILSGIMASLTSGTTPRDETIAEGTAETTPSAITETPAAIVYTPPAIEVTKSAIYATKSAIVPEPAVETAAPVVEPEPEPTPAPAASTGHSYVASSNSDKFHNPSCSSAKQINEGNKIFFETRDEAISRGYIPCKRCNP